MCCYRKMFNFGVVTIILLCIWLHHTQPMTDYLSLLSYKSSVLSLIIHFAQGLESMTLELYEYFENVTHSSLFE